MQLRFLSLLALLSGTALGDSTINSTQRFSYAANGGWINWKWSTSPPQGAVVTESLLSGFIYSSNFGWINLGNGNPANGFSYSQTGGEFVTNFLPDECLGLTDLLYGIEFIIDAGEIITNATAVRHAGEGSVQVIPAVVSNRDQAALGGIPPPAAVPLPATGNAGFVQFGSRILGSDDETGGRRLQGYVLCIEFPQQRVKALERWNSRPFEINEVVVDAVVVDLKFGGSSLSFGGSRYCSPLVGPNASNGGSSVGVASEGGSFNPRCSAMTKSSL